MEPGDETSKSGRRQARLRNEFAAWYPTISVTSWAPAVTVARKVAQQLAGDGPPLAPQWERGTRILDERHFLFRGGVSRPSHLRTRTEDVRTGGETTELGAPEAPSR